MKFEKTVELLGRYHVSNKQVTVQIRNGGGLGFNGNVLRIDPDNDVVLIHYPGTEDEHHVTISEIVVISTD